MLQNVFIKAWKYLGKFDNRSTFYTWIYRIAYNETIDQITRNKKHSHTDIDDPSAFNSVKAQTNSLYSGTEIKKKLDDAINTLPAKQKMVFNMKYFEEKKYDEIANITGTSTGALKASYFHAVKKIETFLKNDQTF